MVINKHAKSLDFFSLESVRFPIASTRGFWR